jgi:acetoin:2,6-dichlorophenolindophenol oxidoreductase subunit beta
MSNNTVMMDAGKALNSAFFEEMRRDESVVLWGEDIISMGSPWAGIEMMTEGLFEEFGHDRIRDTPVVENTIAAMTVGSAMTGLRPVAFIMTGGFQMGCFDAIFSRLGNAHQEWQHKGTVPAVIVSCVLGGAAKGADHALSPESLFMHSPGLKIVMPSTAYDAKGLMKAAIRDDSPVLFYTHRECLYMEAESLPEEEYVIPLGKADIKREGSDVTIVTYSGMVHRALKAADELSAQGISAEVVDLRTLVPLDVETVVASAKKTGALLIVHEAMTRSGAAGEIAFRVMEHAPELVKELRHPIKRLGAKNLALSTNQEFEDKCVPHAPDIVREVKKLV